MDDALGDAVHRLLSGTCTGALVREVERTRQATALWSSIEDGGYADALVDEAHGGAGLGLRDVFGLLLACGRHALPVPLAPTLMVRGALARLGLPRPAGAVALAPQARVLDGGVVASRGVPFGQVADWALVPMAQGAWLLPVAAADREDTGVHGSLQAHLSWRERPAQAVAVGADWPWLQMGALQTAATMAGAMQRVLDDTVAYANQRVQFGKSIGRFQAVQQQLAVMAEQVFAARMAAQIGCARGDVRPQALQAAQAKARAGEAAQLVVAIAHAVHGAIGVTAEYDLQLYTRRLQEWRSDFGSQAYWHAQLGAALLADRRGSTSFMLAELTPDSPVENPLKR